MGMEHQIRFGVFELDPVAGQLRKSGVPVPLSGQPLDVLTLLVRRPGEVVTREELKEALWPDETFVDFDNGVNSAIRRIRRALDDSPSSPRFLETLPKRGYRFIAPVGRPGSALVEARPERDEGADDIKQLQASAKSRTKVQEAVESPRWTRSLPWALAGVLAVFAAGLSFVHFREPAAERLLNRFSITPDSMWATRYQTTAISPNGRHVVFASGGGERMLWVRDLDRAEPRMLEGTEGAGTPFWSSDSRYIAFDANSELKRVAVEGGRVVKLCDLPREILDGGSWSPDGTTILVSTGIGAPQVFEVSSAGGTLTPFPLEGSSKGPAVQTPVFLPEGSGPRGLIYNAGSMVSRDVLVKNLESGETHVLAEGVFPVYSPSGHIVYQTSFSEALLWALPFSLETLQATGEPFVVAEGGVDPSVSADGTLVYRNPEVAHQQLGWRDRQGRKMASVGQPQNEIGFPALSPDGASVAVGGLEQGGWDVWIHQVNRSVKQRLTFFDGLDHFPVWSPSGAELAFRSHRSGRGDIFLISADRDGEPERLGGSDVVDSPSDWSRDGRFLLYTVRNLPGTSSDVSYLKRVQGGKFEAVPFLQSPFAEVSGQFSPDGRFVAYCSDESGQSEVYVREFPTGADRVRVSENGGCQPRWSDNGKELFYVEGSTLMAVQIDTSDEFAVVQAEPLFSDPNLAVNNMIRIAYDVSADGQRFILRQPAEVEQAERPSIQIVQTGVFT